MYKLLIADNKPERREFSQQVFGRQGGDVVLAETVDVLTLLLKGKKFVSRQTKRQGVQL